MSRWTNRVLEENGTQLDKPKTEIDFKKFLRDLSKKTSQKIVVTTGTIETNLINKLKSSSNKLNDSLYELELDDSKGYLFTNENFYSISHLISKSSLFISCHGAFTHIASNYKIKILDIIEKSKIVHYGKIRNSFLNGEKNKYYAQIEAQTQNYNYEQRIAHHESCRSEKTLQLRKLDPLMKDWSKYGINTEVNYDKDVGN